MTDYVPVFVHFALAVALTAVLLTAHALVGGWRSARAGGARRPLPGQAEPYESGVWPIGSARERVPIRYYLIAMLFLLFDVVAVFLYPWAVVAYREPALLPTAFRGPVFWEVLIFLFTLALAYVYAWRKGVFRWR